MQKQDHASVCTGKVLEQPPQELNLFEAGCSPVVHDQDPTGVVTRGWRNGIGNPHVRQESIESHQHRFGAVREKDLNLQARLRAKCARENATVMIEDLIRVGHEHSAEFLLRDALHQPVEAGPVLRAQKNLLSVHYLWSPQCTVAAAPLASNCMLVGTFGTGRSRVCPGRAPRRLNT